MAIPFCEDFVSSAGSSSEVGWGDGVYSGHGTFEYTGLPFVLERYKSTQGHGGGEFTGSLMGQVCYVYPATSLCGAGGGTACANGMIGFAGPYSI